MTQEHPITPSTELVKQWREMPEYASISEKLFTVNITTNKLQDIATQAARWGADQELEACCEWLRHDLDAYELVGLRAVYLDHNLRNARRPKPPSLKEQALKELKDWTNEKHGPGGEVLLCEGLSVAIIREALESLPE